MRAARRAARLRQAQLAAEVGCNQSALSMFEQGDGTKLNDETIARLAKKFGLEIGGGVAPAAAQAPARVPGSGYCPNPNCPSNTAYEVEGRRLFRPDRAAADPVGGMYCAVCGELLERTCPGCGANVHAGAVCSLCGTPYVAAE